MKKILFVIFTLLSIGHVLAQNNVRYSGRVLSEENNEPLIGAAVTVRDANIGVVTDTKGEFSFNGPKDALLQFSYMGYVTKELKGIPDVRVTVTLATDQTQLDEVVVVGYGMVRKSELTTASSGIRASEMITEGTTSFEQSLQGKLSGVVIINTEGSPGSAISMQVRGVASISGSSEPLYVIDGMTIESGEDLTSTQSGFGANNGMAAMNAMASLNPNDIESIEVLKDASATAIYGSRGANGVVLITTKSGKVGTARVNFSYNLGISDILKKVEVLSPREHAEWRYFSANMGAANSPENREEELSRYPDSRTRWLDAILRTALSSEYSLSVSGGTKGFNYMVSGNYLDQQGIIINSNFQRMSFRANLTWNIFKDSKISVKSNLTRNLYNSVPTSARNADVDQQGLIKLCLRKRPDIPLFYNEFNEDDEEHDVAVNPYTTATQSTRLTTNNRLVTAVNMDINLSKNLIFKPLVGIDYTVSRADTYYPPTTQQGRPAAGNDPGNARISYTETNKWNWDNQLVYTNTFCKVHSLTATAVYSIEEKMPNVLTASSRGFANDDLLMYALQNGLTETYGINSNTTRTSLMSFLGRVNYSYDKRYIITPSLRIDGSSKFGKNNRWAYFPSVSGAWNANQEKALKDFFRSIKVNNFRTRLSWGVVGNQSIPVNRAMTTLNAGGKYPAVGTTVDTAIPTRIANPDLKWETTESINFGSDIGLFQNRITFTYNYYNKITRDLLQEVMIPSSTGFTNQYQNTGKIRNRGHEVEVTGIPMEKRDFKWNIAANISFNHNVILDLGGPSEMFTENLGSGGSMSYTPFIQKVGSPLGMLWGYKTDGVYQRPSDYAHITESVYHTLGAEDSQSLRDDKMLGSIRIVDTNGDGKITLEDKVRIGDVNPDYTFGITNTLTYKKVTLSFLFQGSVGGDIYNTLKGDIEVLQGGVNISPAAYYGRWQGEGTSNYFPVAKDNNNSNRDNESLDRYVEDGTYVRLKNVRISYNFDRNTFKLPAFPQGSIYVNISNAITWTKYSGFDPEVSSYGQNAARRGVDMGAYPHSRTWSFGLSLNF